MARNSAVTSLICFLVLAGTSRAQPGNENAVLEMQQEKLGALAFMDGVWRGTAWMLTPSGDRKELTQTERIGPMLGGALKVIEGCGYDADGKQVFHAFAVISYDTQKEQYTMRSYAQGRQGDFVVQPREDGFTWSIPAGPATIRYTARIQDGTWQETGERIVGEGKPVQFFSMSLTRVSDTKWPAEGAVPLH